MLFYLLRPFAYLTIRHSSGLTKVVNWWVPGILAIVIVAFGAVFASAIDLVGATGIVARMLGLVQTLAGFYIAALAAVATFSSEGMDKLMAGEPPTMKVLYNHCSTRIPLTRRRFLCSMFAFLTAMSLLIAVVAIGALAFGPIAGDLICMELRGVARALFAFVFVFASLQMLSVTLWGLFYLGERMHTPD